MTSSRHTITSQLNRQAWIRNLETVVTGTLLLTDSQTAFSVSVLKEAETSNYKSATTSDVRNKVEKQIREEIRNGNYIVTHVKQPIVSAPGAFPKPDTDKIPLIHDCSRPQFSNVNSYATPQNFSYVTVEKAVSQINPNAYLTKIDLKSAYHHVPIHPSNYRVTILVSRAYDLLVSGWIVGPGNSR